LNNYCSVRRIKLSQANPVTWQTNTGIIRSISKKGTTDGGKGGVVPLHLVDLYNQATEDRTEQEQKQGEFDFCIMPCSYISETTFFSSPAKAMGTRLGSSLIGLESPGEELNNYCSVRRIKLSQANPVTWQTNTGIIRSISNKGYEEGCKNHLQTLLFLLFHSGQFECKV
jgi:hypothetical protein